MQSELKKEYKTELQLLLCNNLCCDISDNKLNNEIGVKQIYSIDNFARIDSVNTGTESRVLQIDDTLYIVFRDTQMGTIDFLIDLLFMKKSVPYNNTSKDIKVHTGFITAYRSVRHFMQYVVQELRDKSNIKKVVVTGFSLGGALATLCGLDIKYNMPSLQVDVVTFGAPRVGNKEFAKSYNKRMIANTYRVINGEDLVTKIPYKWLGYNHVGTPLYGYIQLGKLASKWNIISKIFGRFLRDHNIHKYRENLLKVIDKVKGL